MTDTATEWAWYKSGHNAQGPFPTREAAVEDARENFYGDTLTTVIVGTVTYTKPEDWVDVDMDDLLTNATERFGENVYIDDKVFYVEPKRQTEAEADLRRVLKEWARRWVETQSYQWYVDDGEEVEVGGDEDGEGS